MTARLMIRMTILLIRLPMGRVKISAIMQTAVAMRNMRSYRLIV